MKIVVIDPRRTATCEIADLHLPLAPGTDVWLFNGLLAYLHEHGHVDRAFVDAHTNGFDASAGRRARDGRRRRAPSPRPAASSDAAAEFYELFARTARVVTAFSQGVNQSSAAPTRSTSIINCHLLTGRIGKPGMGPFSITGQPNAMGGREVGGMANMLAAHMDLDDASASRRRAAVLAQPAHRAAAGTESGRDVRGIHDGRDQGASGSWRRIRS